MYKPRARSLEWRLLSKIYNFLYKLRGKQCTPVKIILKMSKQTTTDYKKFSIIFIQNNIYNTFISNDHNRIDELIFKHFPSVTGQHVNSKPGQVTCTSESNFISPSYANQVNGLARTLGADNYRKLLSPPAARNLESSGTHNGRRAAVAYLLRSPLYNARKKKPSRRTERRAGRRHKNGRKVAARSRKRNFSFVL